MESAHKLRPCVHKSGTVPRKIEHLGPPRCPCSDKRRSRVFVVAWIMHGHYNRDATERDRGDITEGPRFPPFSPSPNRASYPNAAWYPASIPITGSGASFSFSRCPLLNRPRRFRRIPAHAACVEPQSYVMLITLAELHRGSIPTASPDKISRILAAPGHPPVLPRPAGN